MFDNWKRKRLGKKAADQAVAESQHWKTHPQLQSCLQSMRGSCTVAPMQLHEAAIAAVNIALSEESWTRSELLPEDFLAETVYIVWDNERFPVLTAPRDLIVQNLAVITAVAEQTFLVSETMDRIARWQDGQFSLYSIA